MLLTIVAAAVIFEPARRQLKLLQQASVRLGAGDLTARAPAAGGDEVAQVAASFNRMAEELAARDEALRASDRLRRQMLADVSHELKTPLTAMRSYVETLRDEDIALDRDTRERYFATLERETIRLDRIVKDLLDLARLENSVVHLDLRVFATRRVFEHVVGRHQPEIERRRIAVRIDVSSAADQMVADPDRIEQVVENLFANGLRHTPDGGSLALAATIDEHVVKLSVTDSGSGIPPEHVPLVFERFYKVDASRATESGGSGLGLSISRAIVERHGGWITRVEPARLHGLHDCLASGRVDELVAHAPGGEDQFGILRIDFDFPAQPADDRIDRAVRDVGVAAPHPREQRLAVEDDPGMRSSRRRSKSNSCFVSSMADPRTLTRACRDRSSDRCAR